MRAITAPSPVLGVLDEACPHGVQINIAANLQHISVAIDQDRFEAPLEQMAKSLVPAVTLLGINAIHVTHESREICPMSLEHEVVVIGHQAIRETSGIETFQGLSNDIEERPSVSVVFEDRLTPVAARGYVIERTREFQSQRS